MALTLKELQSQIDELREKIEGLANNSKPTLIIKKKLGIGDTFELLNLTWKILDITDKGYVCLAGRLEDAMKFDNSSNDWKSSDLREYLNNEFYEELAEAIGADNIIPFERDLLSMDGLTDYGTCEDKVSILNVDEYRKYRQLIPNTEDYWWWTLTADSCKSNKDSCWVRVVSSSGYFYGRVCNSGGGVRPFCIFSSSIFESGE